MPDPLTRDWLANRYVAMIRRALAGELGAGEVELVELVFVVGAEGGLAYNQVDKAA